MSKKEKMQELQNEINELENAPPHRDSPAELKAKEAKEDKRQLEYLASDNCKVWREKFPERYKADVERLGGELPKSKVAKKAPKVEKPKEEAKPEKEEEPKPEEKEVEKPKKKEKNK